ncbi:MAG: FHA domain-containing protein [Acidobacteria bacterium]|nr:MAG: FHA domain-containing protein [Acidobacteriota bacterium]
MIRVVCPHCQTKYRFDESQLGGKSRAQAKCKKCGGTIDITNTKSAATAQRPSMEAPPSEPSSDDTTARVQKLRSDEPVGEQTITGTAAVEKMELPADKKYSLAVLQGKASGQIFSINKVRTVIGRADCDVILDDPESSRQHAALEVLGSRIVVSDLKSTNGTFVNGEQIDSAELQNHSEFRIGEHVLMLIVTDRE